MVERRSEPRRDQDKRLEEEVASVQEALQNAWLNKYGVTRVFRWVFMMLASAFIALFIVDARVTPEQRESCERRQIIFEEIKLTLEEAGNDLALEADSQRRRADAVDNELTGRETAKALRENAAGLDERSQRYKERAAKVRANIVEDCNAEYEHIPPFNWLLD